MGHKNNIRQFVVIRGWLAKFTGIVLLMAAQHAVGATVALRDGVMVNSKFGWQYGNVAAKTAQTFTFQGNAKDYFLHLRPYDVDSATELRVLLNGQLLGYLPAGNNNRYAPRVLFYLPAALQAQGTNTLRLMQQNKGFRWGVTEVGLYSANSARTMFGNLKPLNKDTRHKGRVLIQLPFGTGASELVLKFFDVDDEAEVEIRSDEADAGRADVTNNNKWGDTQRFYLPDNTRFVEIDNTYNGPNKYVWGVKLVGVTPLGAPASGQPLPFDPLTFDMVTEAQWNELAVRRVLQVFAWGGQSSDDQISQWAAMAPQTAIVEILNFDQHNLKLSPLSAADRDRLDRQPNTLAGLSAFWTSKHTRNETPEDLRYRFEIGSRNYYLWTRAALSRGLNPFRHKIGLWETNYHMAVNMATNVNARQLVRYYDDIVFAHERNRRYDEIIAVAAKSAAVATQYQHRRNRFRNGICECNEDFAREFYQLFFGILGDGDSEYHETTTIKNMALSLTDMQVNWSSTLQRYPDTVSFGTRYHYDGPVEMLHTQILGTTARDRIESVSQSAIAHWESNQNLPVKIIGDLADDNLSADNISALRVAWASMANDDKSVLRFLRAYAVSTLFHDPSRIKYWTTFDRHLILANRFLHTNRENYLERYNPAKYFSGEEAQVFYPTHNVFGNQRATEAAASALVFMKNYNLWVEKLGTFSRAHGDDYGVEWEKDWSRVIPTNNDDEYVVAEVAAWLWQHVVGDGLANFGPVERAHLYALLGDRHNLMMLLDENALDRVITADDVVNDPAVVNLVAELGARRLALQSSDIETRRDANQDVGEAFAFIAATPFVFAQASH